MAFNPPSSQPASSPFSLFPSSSSTSQPAQASSLFSNLGGAGGAATSSTAPANNLFGFFGGGNTGQTGTTNLFSNLGKTSAPSQPTQTPSLFSTNLGASSAASQPASTAPTNLFGGLGGNTLGGGTNSNIFNPLPNKDPASGTAAQSTASKPAQTTNLFGSAGGRNTGLFGPKPTTTATQPGVFPSLLNPNANSTSEQGPAASTAQRARETQQPIYFSSLLEKNKKRARGMEEMQSLNDVPTLQLGLGDISKRIKELGTPQARREKGADAKAHYLLAASGVNPGTALKDLKAFSTQIPAQASAAAQAGFDPDSHRYVEQMQQQMTLKMINEGIEKANKRFDEYLQEHIEMNWEQQKRRVYEHFGLSLKGLDDDDTATPLKQTGGFGRSSRRGKQGQDSLSKSTGARSIFGISGMQRSVLGSSTGKVGTARLFGEGNTQYPPLNEDPYQRERRTKLAEKLQDLSQSRIDAKFYPIFKEFIEAEQTLGIDTTQQVFDSYKALIEITNEDNLTDFKPRRFAPEYLDDNINSENSVKSRQRIINGSRRALEQQFFENLTTNVTRNVKEASLGGAPTRINKVRAYIRVRVTRKDLAPEGVFLQRVGDDYCWALIFYLLRCGFYTEAAEYVTENNNAFMSIDRMFATYITLFIKSSDRRLLNPQQNKINNEYMSRMRLAPENTLDPFRMACYKILGRCELSKRTLDGISQGVEDWIWLQFCLARESNRAEELATEVYGLKEVQDTIKEIGQRHFAKPADSNPSGHGTYFYLQILGGLFEEAIAYLARYAFVSAVHFAIGLDFYGLLKVVTEFDPTSTNLLNYTTRGTPTLNLPLLLTTYTSPYHSSLPVSSIDYLLILHLSASLPAPTGPLYHTLTLECLRELVLETREFAQLLGDIYADGHRINGAIEQRLPLIGLSDTEDFLREVTLQAARVADENGRVTDAVLLYHLAEEEDRVMRVLNRALSESLNTELGTAEMLVEGLKPRTEDSAIVGKGKQRANSNSAIDLRARAKGSSLSLAGVSSPRVLAEHFSNLYARSAASLNRIQESTRTACGQLLQIASARQAIEEEKWEEGLELLGGLNIIPLNARGDISTLRQAAGNLGVQSTEVVRLAGGMLIWGVRAVGGERERLFGGGGMDGMEIYESRTRDEIGAELVGKAKDLMVYAGLVRLRLGKGVWERIVGGCAEMGVV